MATALSATTAGSSPSSGSKRKSPKPIYLTHERDFFRQIARRESMDSYVLVSTLTSSVSFGALIEFSRSEAIAAAIKSSSTSAAALLELFYD
jgi:hypothetical protein